MFLRNWLTFSNERLNKEANGVLCHDDGLFDGFALCYASWQGWYGYCVTSLIGVRIQNDSISVLTHRSSAALICGNFGLIAYHLFITKYIIALLMHINKIIWPSVGADLSCPSPIYRPAGACCSILVIL